MYITRQEAEAYLNASLLTRWINAGFIPMDEAGRLSLEYLQRVVQFIGDRPAHQEHALLCMLEWRTVNQPESREEISKTVDQLLATPDFLKTQEVAILLGYSERAILRWAELGFLPAARIVRKHRRFNVILVYWRRDVIRIKRIMDGLTVYEVGSLLEMGPTHIAVLAQKGRIPAVKTPNGWRFNPEDVEVYIAAHAGFTDSEAQALIGISNGIFKRWVAGGHITPTGKKREKGYLYDRASVLSVKARVEKLRGGFEGWLPTTIQEQTYTPKIAARKLGISTHTVSTWVEDELLPYFDLSAPEAETHPSRLYVAAYVDLLAQFAKSQNAQPTKLLAHAFKEHMRAHYAQEP